MPDQPRPRDQSPAERAADHDGIAVLCEALVPALVARLGSGSLGEVEIREGDWHVRVRRAAAVAARRERPHRAALPIVAPPGAASVGSAVHAHPGVADAAPGVRFRDEGEPDGPRQEAALAPAVGLFRPGAPVGARVRSGDRIAAVDLLGIAVDVVAPIDGTLVEVYPQAGDGVEYGEEVALIQASVAAAPAADTAEEG